MQEQEIGFNSIFFFFFKYSWSEFKHFILNFGLYMSIVLFPFRLTLSKSFQGNLVLYIWI